MRDLAFIINTIEDQDGFYKFALKGYSGVYEYDLYFFIKKDLPAGTMKTGEFLFHENAIKFQKRSDLGNNIIPVLCEKLSVDQKEIKSKEIREEIAIFNLFPQSGDPSQIYAVNSSLKGFMGDGSIEFYIDIQPLTKVLLVNVRQGCELDFINYICK